MDPRIREHARILVEHSTGVEAGDDVIVAAPPVADDLAVALHEVIGEIGATPLYLNRSERARRAYLKASDEDGLSFPEAYHEAIRAADVLISIRASENTHERSDVAPSMVTAQQSLTVPVQEAVMETRWVATQHPAPGSAQVAEMSTEAYADFVYAAVNRDWDAQRERQAAVVERLDESNEVHVVSGADTDLRMSIDGMLAENDFGENNLPGGEVFTAPVPDSVEGTVHFDMPLLAHDRVVEDVVLTFEEGVVVDSSAGENEAVLEAVLETDDGARRLGELGIGMNRDIDRFSYNMLFDEKMGDTVHMALGRAYAETVGEGREQNESAIHMDMIVDMAEDSRIEIDGEVIQRDGRFWFEDGFVS